MQITDAEKSLIMAVRGLEFGRLMPTALGMTATQRLEVPSEDLSTAEKALLSAIMLFGRPEVVEVANRAPTYAIFSVATDVGLGEKRVKFN